MTYREQARACPRCQLALEQVGERPKWRCKACVGALVGFDELGAELDNAALAPRTASEEPLTCPLCSAGLEPVELFGVPLDRCAADRVVWFDAGELGRVRKVRTLANEPDPADELRAAMQRLLGEKH